MSVLLLIIIYLAFVGIGLPNSLLGAAWPAVFPEINVPDSYLGIISLIIMGCTVFSCVFCAKLVKHFKTGIIIPAGIIMIAAALFGFAVTHSFALMCVLAAPLGLGAGLIDTGLNDYVANNYKAKQMNWLHCFWGLGAVMGPLILSFAITLTESWRSGYYTIGGFQILLAVILLLTLPLWEKAEKLKSPEPLKEKPKGALKLKGAKLALLSFFLYCSLETTVGLWGSTYLVMTKNLSQEAGARWISLFFFGITFGRLVSGFLTMKLSTRRTIRLSYLIVAAGIILIFLPLGSFSYIAGFLLIGLGCAPIFPCLVHETPARFGREHSAAIIGLQIASAYIGSAAAPFVFGIIAGRIGYGFFPVFLLLALAGTIIVIELLDKKTSL